VEVYASRVVRPSRPSHGHSLSLPNKLVCSSKHGLSRPNASTLQRSNAPRATPYSVPDPTSLVVSPLLPDAKVSTFGPLLLSAGLPSCMMCGVCQYCTEYGVRSMEYGVWSMSTPYAVLYSSHLCFVAHAHLSRPCL
jgi:hypothetical protein